MDTIKNFLLELMKEIGLFAILMEFTKKKVEHVLSPRGLEDNAIFREALSGLSCQEMAYVTQAMNDHMTKEERIEFRLLIAISQNVGRTKGAEKEKDDKDGKKKEPKSESLNLGTKVLKGYVTEFSKSGTCDVEVMAAQMKQDLENLPEPLKVFMGKVKSFVATNSTSVLNGLDNLKSTLQTKLGPYVRREKKFGQGFFSSIKDEYNKGRK